MFVAEHIGCPGRRHEKFHVVSGTTVKMLFEMEKEHRETLSTSFSSVIPFREMLL